MYFVWAAATNGPDACPMPIEPAPVPARKAKGPVSEAFTSSARGGQLLSASQLPFHLMRPPTAYGVLTTSGRKTGKRRRRCVRAVRRGETACLVAIKGSAKTGWVRNALANPEVTLRLPGGSYSGRARRIAPPERSQAREAYVETVAPFDYLTYVNWRKGHSTRRDDSYGFHTPRIPTSNASARCSYK
jgi:deazaflavin-dependent oxidoreductase (nitroreductase family)